MEGSPAAAGVAAAVGDVVVEDCLLGDHLRHHSLPIRCRATSIQAMEVSYCCYCYLIGRLRRILPRILLASAVYAWFVCSETRPSPGRRKNSRF